MMSEKLCWKSDSNISSKNQVDISSKTRRELPGGLYECSATGPKTPRKNTALSKTATQQKMNNWTTKTLF